MRYCLCLYLSENEKTLPQKTIELLLLYVVCMGLQYPKTHSGRPFLDENKLYVLNCMYSRRLMGTKLAKNLKMVWPNLPPANGLCDSLSNCS